MAHLNVLLMMEENKEKYYQKLAGYISGNISPEEKQRLFALGESNAAVKEDLTDAESVWKKTDAGQNYEPDTEKAWQRFRLKAEMRKPRKRFLQTKHLAIAASLVLLLSVSYVVHNYINSENLISVHTPAGETRVLDLSDGSRITMNENSTISYSSGFNSDNRLVRLDGEAFFEVARAEGKRFTVYAGNSITEVIGTAFNIKTFKDSVAIHVSSGKVAFAHKDKQDAIFLKPGQQATLNTAHVTPVKEPVRDINYSAWKSRKLSFDNMPLEEIARALEAYFKVNISIRTGELQNCRFTASFDNPQLEEVLDVLSLTGNIDIEKEANHYILSGQGCK
ncbi:DUF4974 domain-containing protein [Cytophagaceae bacterium ABcell3]|nr:DUF4974 domain-containing protein [Cytophagaceae bacterium ABcell3]